MKTLTDILYDIPKWNSSVQLAVIDLFCGAGGYSWGVKKARINGMQVAKVAICVNHDAKAIASHYANMPDALHLIEDIRTVSMIPFIEVVDSIRLHHPHIKILLHASLECTNHSKAKGGMSRDADSRTLADHLFRYIEAIQPDYISIENVEEFLIWGPLQIKEVKCKTGDYCPIEVKQRKPTKAAPKRVQSVNPVWIPVKEQKGIHYHEWISKVKAYGFEYDYRILNSADYGAFTSRKRYFALFAANGLPIAWPEPTHEKNPKPSLFEQKEQWRAVKEVLSLHLQGESIFTKKTIPVEATLERIFAGLVRFVAGGKKEYLLKYNSMSQRKKYVAPGVDEPCPTISTQGRLCIVQPQFLSKYFSGNPESKNSSINNPAGAITCCDHHSLVHVDFISKYFSGSPENKNSSIQTPAPTITTKDRLALVHADFLSSYYGNGGNRSTNEPAPTVTTVDRFAYVSPQFLSSYHYSDQPKSIADPCQTLTTKDKIALVSTAFMDMQYGNGVAKSINDPAATITSTPKHNVVTVSPWVMNTNFSNVGGSINEPAHTITSDRHWHYLLNPQYKNSGGNINTPCFTLIARMDKMPPYLMKAETSGDMAPFIHFVNGVLVYEIYDTDSPAMVKIKEFMAMYGLIDIKMRMLMIDELKRIMGFPTEYVLKGTQADQKKFIGNAVETTQAEANIVALCLRLLHHDKQKHKLTQLQTA